MSTPLAADEIALFPLAQVVLFPRVRVPLLIFEPRYRQMTHDAIAAQTPIGMIAVKPDGVAEMAADPPIFDVGCAGRIAECKERPDGTLDIILEGTHRFRVLSEELPKGGRLYRVAQFEALVDPIPDAELEPIAKLRADVLDMLQRIVARRSGPDAEPPPTDVFETVDHTTVANTLAQTLGVSPLEKQTLLEANSILDRFDQLATLLRFHLLEMESARPGEEGVVH